MLVKLADKQVITAPAPGPSIIYTDPIELGAFNRAAAILVTHYAHGNMTFRYALQVSNDLDAWVDEGPSDSFSGPPGPPLQSSGSVTGRYLRARLSLDGGTAGTSGQVCVDLKVRLEVESLNQH